MLKLTLKNIGKIKDATVIINSITVVAGENNTGKSTISKCLFAISNSFYELDKKIEDERKKSIAGVLARIHRYLINEKKVFIHVDEDILSNIIMSALNSKKVVNKDIQKLVVDVIQQYDRNIIINIDQEELKDICSNIQAVLQISDFEILHSILEKKLEAEFNGQICNVFNREAGEIQVELKNRQFAVLIRDDRIREMSKDSILPINGDVIYIDDPFLLEDYKKFLFPFFYGLFDHQSYMRQKLNMIRNDGNIVNEIIIKNKLESIYNKISLVCDGNIVFDGNKRLVYKFKESDKVLNVHNLSTGLKSFGILKMLLENDTLGQNGILIFDEPEIHLHPDWQLIFAELIVLLQKEFRLHVLVNTHSPYFLRAIQVYAAAHEIADTCTYYLSEEQGGAAFFTDVTDCIEKVYSKLSRPFQRLEDVRWQNDSIE